MATGSTSFGRTVARVRTAAHFERIAWRRRSPVIGEQVLYEAFSGNGMLDNPEAIFQALLAAPDLKDRLRHVWVLNDFDAYRPTIERYRSDPRVSFVRYGSDRYEEALARSRYLINNATFPPQFGKREGQVYVNTWHGVPLKHMGYDIPGGGPATRNIIRNFVSADHLLSANEFMTRQMYESAYKLRGIYRGRLIQEGSPRIDRQFLTDDQRAQVLGRLSGRGVSADGRQIVLYAPTWRGSFYAPVNDAVQLLNRVRRLTRLIDTDRYQVLLKVHQRVFDFAAAHPELRDLLVPNDLPTNEMLGVTGVLVTDYSSIFYDFLPTGRPVLFFQPDEHLYSGDRGLYQGIDTLPGPVSRTIDALAAHLTAIGTREDDDPLVTHAERYEQAREKYCPKEDGGATERVVDVVFRGRTEGYDVRDDFSDGRTSLLVYLGGMRSNGITKSALGLLDTIDHTKFDVSVLYAANASADVRRNEAAINPNVRLFPRLGGLNGSKLLWFGRQAMLTKGVDAVAPHQRRLQERSLHDEWVRCFGASRFDHIVDFSGYSPFWAHLLLQGEARTHSVFQHNDLLADSMREVDGRRPHESNLRSVFSTYRQFDNLISVSPALAEINRTKLSAFAGSARFVSAHNTVQHEQVLRQAYGQEPEASGPAVAPTDLANLPATVAALMEHHPIDAILQEANRRGSVQRLVPPVPDMVTFVTAGRLSPEKNHARLLRAFDLVHQEHANTRLVIMGGGPLRDELTALVDELGLSTVATLSGQLENPYAIMAAADCFVLSSDYEGQPMVILEAMVLGLPVVSTEFASVRGALPEGTGRVTPQTVEGLAEGMTAYLRGEVPAATLDAEKYNQDAVEQFLAAIGAESGQAEGDPVEDVVLTRHDRS